MLITGSGSCAGFSAHIVNRVMNSLLIMVEGMEDAVESRSNVVPGPIVFMFFLNPNEFGIGILFEMFIGLYVGEGSELFYPDDSYSLFRLLRRN